MGFFFPNLLTVFVGISKISIAIMAAGNKNVCSFIFVSSKCDMLWSIFKSEQNNIITQLQYCAILEYVTFDGTLKVLGIMTLFLRSPMEALQTFKPLTVQPLPKLCSNLNLSLQIV